MVLNGEIQGKMSSFSGSPTTAATRKFESGPAAAVSPSDCLGVGRGVRVDRHRLSPAEADQHHQDRAGRVQVRQRVQGDAAARAGQAVAEEVGDVGVRELVEGDAGDEGGGDGGDEDEGGERVVADQAEVEDHLLLNLTLAGRG